MYKLSTFGQAIKTQANQLHEKKSEMFIENLPTNENYQITQRTDITVFVENPYEPTDQLLEHQKEPSKLTSYIISI